MSDNGERSGRAGVPSSESVVAEKSFAPNRPMTDSPTAGPGPTYRILRTVEVDEYDPPVSAADVQPFGEAQPEANQNFTGTSRKAAKLSISDSAVEAFDDVAALIDTLPDHQSMVGHEPEITTAANSGRVDSEDRNIRITAFLYAASHENDNDYHLIVGRDPARDPVYMTMELSGLPPATSEHFARLDEARHSYSSFFGGDLPGTSYDFYDPPIPIEVEGSLFFDMSHATGSRPGPQSLRGDMPVVWEIHPIARIAFEP
ncbi:hypothetical protein NKI31_12685 [Mesorhizobium sp. M0659]|uniref:hypothetical protein n=1 Tax=Mesorhizobium sp. M0659 TaxID=2956980 RepID=UPI0033393EAA